MSRTDRHEFVNMKVAYDEKKSGVAVYNAPQGWMITGHRNHHESKWGGSGYSCDLTRSQSSIDYQSRLESQIQEEKKLAAEIKDDKAKAEWYGRLWHVEQTVLKLSGSHDTLLVHWTCKGAGSFVDRTRGKLELIKDIDLEKV